MPLTAQIHLKLWLDYEGEVLMGAGRAELLHRIAAMGSLKKAAESMGMSYRAAWGRIKRAEAAFGRDLVQAVGARRDGYQLTPEAQKLVQAFMAWEEDVRKYAVAKAATLPLKVESTTAADTTE